LADTKRRGRRSFLKTVAAAGVAAPSAAAQNAPAPAGARLPAGGTSSSAPPHAAFSYPRTFSGRNLQMIAFPLGGVAAGSISLGGRGQLRDWEIFNRADKGRSPNYAFPSIWVRAGQAKPVARVLEARLMPPYEGPSGLGSNNAPGLDRLSSAVFTAEFPLARVAFRDPELPVRVSLEAFTPFIPLDAEASGMPIAVLRYAVKNTGNQPAAVAIAWSIDNPVGAEPRGAASRVPTIARRNEFRSASGIQGLFMTNSTLAADDPANGSFAVAVLDAGDAGVTHLTGWPRAKWWASPLLFWDDFSSDGELGPEANERNAVGSLSMLRKLPPGEERHFTFLLAWHFPNRTPAGCGWTAPKGDENAIIGNHYCRRFADAWDAAARAASALPDLEKRTRAFVSAIRETTLPAPVREAAMSNLSTLVTNTSFRTADGRFRGFEGTFDQRGCCYGTCTHVWNYESATDFLLPALARSMRESAFELSARLDGVLPIRLELPLGKQTGGTTAADGTMGQIIKTYLDWLLAGDDGWLRSLWPAVKQALEFCWVPGGWDANLDGVMEGAQHNTYDVEFYGPNPMCGIYYLGGLRAGEEMARAMGDAGFANQCRALFQKGSAWIDANLFNGAYYIQQVRGIPQDSIAAPLRSRGGAEDPEHPDFQLADGCLVDQLVGQYVAEFAGLGPLVDRAKIRKTLESIYRYNYKRSLYKHESVQRTFALNDEAALVICDYGHGQRPKVPFPYFAEVMTGFEYSAACLMLYYGMEKQGIECIENIRRRYDGERRNPFDEAECGHHYARAMAAWTGILALSGFRFDGATKSVVALPRIAGTRFHSFWSTAAGWGTFTLSTDTGGIRFALAVAEGSLACRSVEFRAAASAGAAAARLGAEAVDHEVRREGDRAIFTFAGERRLTPGERLELTI
jgi:uncharacterized protein (DUF608 family)